MYKVATLNKISQKGLGLLQDRQERYELTENAADANAIIVRSANMLDMEMHDGLLAIARAGAGYNNIPVDECSKRGIVVFNTPGANANAVKELVIAAMLMASRNVPDALEWTKGLGSGIAEAVEKGKAQFAGEEIQGKTLGVVGLGYIGVLVANAAEALGMRVVGYDPYLSVKAAHDLSATVKLYEPLESMLPECDYVTIHVPANAETTGMFDYKVISAMKNKGVLLNFSRDLLVNGADLRRAMGEKKLRMYVTDFPTDEMIGVEGAVLIPHLGASTKESEENCAVMAVKEVINYLESGTIENSVNYPTVQAGAKTSKGSRIVTLHRNVPSIIGRLAGAVADQGINISDMINKSKGDNQITILDCDSPVDHEKIRTAFAFDGVISVRIIE